MAFSASKGRKKSKTVVDITRVRDIAKMSKDRALDEAEHRELMQAVDLFEHLVTPPFRNNESTKAVVGDSGAEEADESQGGEGGKGTRKGGNGRRKPGDFSNPGQVSIPHPTLKHGDPCPCGCGGTLYRATRSSNIFRHFVGQPPISVTFYETEVLHCRRCDQTFAAPLPDGVGPASYDASAISVIALAKYGTGIPFYRHAAFLGTLGVPIAVSTQYELVASAAKLLGPVHKEMVRLAAQGKLAYIDDTSMTILKFVREANDTRTGIHTTGVLSVHEAFEIGLFITGRNHAGENMAGILKQRCPDLSAMLQMSDALACNFSELETEEDVIASCLTHGRRNFVKVAESFPEETRQALLSIGQIYHNDRLAREQELSPEARLAFHQRESQPVMDEFQTWIKGQLDGETEPNSGLGKAMRYMLKNWESLTLFLRVAGAPLDSNPVERLLKKAVLHRKNSLFYRTIKGAQVGDLYMSLIYTCQLNGANPFDYLTVLQRNADLATASPGDWMPWNYAASVQQRVVLESPS